MGLFAQGRMNQFGIPSAYSAQQPGQPASQVMSGTPMQIPDAPPQQAPGFFAKGGTGRGLLMGGLGGALDGIAVWGGAQPGYSTAMAEQRASEQELKKAELLARLRAELQGDDEPSLIRTLKGMGIDPTSEQGRRIGTDSLTRPFMVGSPETGWNAVGGSYGAPQSGPPPEAIAELRANPSTAAFFDEEFGPGAAEKALGGY